MVMTAGLQPICMQKYPTESFLVICCGRRPWKQYLLTVAIATLVLHSKDIWVRNMSAGIPHINSHSEYCVRAL